MTIQLVTKYIKDKEKENKIENENKNENENENENKVKITNDLSINKILQSDHLKPERENDHLNLEELIQLIEEDLNKIKNKSHIQLEKKINIENALKRYQINMDELNRYIYFDKGKNYTRNLIATDNENYCLLLLCWNKGKYSPIHDHPCDGCWVKVIKGIVNEVRYQLNNDKNELIEIENICASKGVLYMNNSLGLHKIGNPSLEIDAITLHIYSPPYDKCRLWFDPKNPNKNYEAVSCYYSEYGEKII